MKKIHILFKSMILATLLVAVACGGNQPKGDKAAVDYDKLTYPQLMEQASAEQVQAWYDCDSRLDEDEVAARGKELKAQKIRSYVVEKDGQKYQMMAMTDDRIGDFGGTINFRFMKTNK